MSICTYRSVYIDVYSNTRNNYVIIRSRNRNRNRMLSRDGQLLPQSYFLVFTILNIYLVFSSFSSYKSLKCTFIYLVSIFPRRLHATTDTDFCFPLLRCCYCMLRINTLPVITSITSNWPLFTKSEL